MSPRDGSATMGRMLLATTATLVLAAGCGPPPSPGEDTDAPQEDPTTPPDEPPPPPPSSQDGPPAVLTQADDGRRVTLAAGGEVTLRLDNDWLWDQPAVEGDAVVLATVDYLVDPGFTEWVVQAAQPGTAEVAVRGQPNCADPSACPPTTVRLRFSVDP